MSIDFCPQRDQIFCTTFVSKGILSWRTGSSLVLDCLDTGVREDVTLEYRGGSYGGNTSEGGQEGRESISELDFFERIVVAEVVTAEVVATEVVVAAAEVVATEVAAGEVVATEVVVAAAAEVVATEVAAGEVVAAEVVAAEVVTAEVVAAEDEDEDEEERFEFNIAPIIS